MRLRGANRESHADFTHSRRLGLPLVTLLHEMVRQDKKTGLATLCLGGGEAVAMVVKR